MKEHPMTVNSLGPGVNILDPRVKNRQMRWHVLFDMIEDNKFNKIVEVGSQEGRTPWYILANTSRPGVEVHCVDPYEVYDNYGYIEPFVMSDVEKKARYYLSEFIENGSCFMHKKYSVDACNNFDDSSLDLVFIDANHTYDYVKEDIECWYPKIRNGGILSGHDYREPAVPGVERAVNEYFIPISKDVEVTHNNVWYVEK